MKLLNKIIEFFKRIKSKPKSLNEAKTNVEYIDSNRNFLENLQKDTKGYFNKNEILDEIDNNVELIYTLSYERLVQLNKLYEETNLELEKKLNV